MNESNSRVFHRSFGYGRIIAVLSGGFDFLVEFESYGRIKVPSSECKLEKRIASQKLETIVPQKSHITNSNNNVLRKILEAFRLGIVPSSGIRDFTFGREQEVALINTWLQRSEGGMLIFGDYGQGKSHLIRYIKEEAADRGYGVAYCDIGEVPIHRPKKVYKALMKSLTFKSSRGRLNGLHAFLNEYASHIRENGENKLQGSLFSRGLNDLVSRSIGTDFFDWVSGEDVRWFGGQPLPDDMRSANVYCNLLSSIGHASCFFSLASKMEYKGLLLIFDEGESADSPSVIMRRRLMGYNFIKGLMECAKNNAALMNEMVEKEYDGYYKGQRSGLIYSGRLRIPFLSKAPSNMKSIFAFVPGQEHVARELVHDYKCQTIELKELSNEAKANIINKITEWYSTAYKLKLDNPKQFVDKVFQISKTKDNTRSIIKLTIEALDLYRFFPGVPLDRLLRA